MGVPFALASKTGGKGEVFFFAPEEGIGVEACVWVHLNGEATRRAMKKLAGAPIW